MRLIDTHPLDPVENVALDASLFGSMEEGSSDETLRFWEAPRLAVIVGRKLEPLEASCS